MTRDKKNIVAIILARGGSKGIPHKNVVPFCGKPLIAWTIEQLQDVSRISSIWVSSDDEEILAVSAACGAELIRRPADLATDTASSEDAWIHAIGSIEGEGCPVDLVIAPQVTSPLRESSDFEGAIETFYANKCDTLFACSTVSDLLLWRDEPGSGLQAVNFDAHKRQRRQDMPKQFVENGSFYLFTPEHIKQYTCRSGGRTGKYEMAFWKMFEIDSFEDLQVCEALMYSFLLT